MNRSIQTSQQSASVLSHLIILAGLSKFIISLKKTLHLTSGYIRNTLAKSSSSEKTVLRTNLLIMQNRKWAQDEIAKTINTVTEIDKAENLTKQLHKDNITLNSPTPNFAQMKKTLNEQQVKLTNFINSLNQYEHKQNKSDQEFLRNSKSFKQEIKLLYKNAGIKFSPQTFGEEIGEIME
jgi:hypothetical protein